MPLPPALNQAVERAYTAMTTSSHRGVPPFYRDAIYRAFGSIDDQMGYLARAWLALFAARHILPVWQTERPNDPLAQRLADLTEEVLSTNIDHSMALSELDFAWKRLDQLASMDKSAANSSSTQCFYAGYAAFSALSAALLARDPFEDVLIEEEDSDSELDPDTGDTALWASIAWAGRYSRGPFDPVRNQEYWTWWLTEAVPAAWEAAHNSESTG